MKTMWALGLGGMLIMAGGCAAFRTSVKPVDADTAKPLDADYSFTDLQNFGKAFAAKIINSRVVKEAPVPPIFVIMGIQNRTQDHIDTKAITDTIRAEIIQAGKAQFVNEEQRDNLLREQGYQLANCAPETRTAIGKQLGAKYMLSGSLVEIKKESSREVRVSKKEDVFYQLTMDITHLESGLVADTFQEQRVLRASKPLIGW